MDESNYDAVYLPVLFAVDNSLSMTGPLIDTANELVPAIVELCSNSPVLDQKLRLSLVKFNDDAEGVIPLGEPDSFKDHIPVLVPEGRTTRFSSAFECIREELSSIPDMLQSSGVAGKIGIHRPTVFFITDGEDQGNPGETTAAWEALTDPKFPYHPNFFSFGLSEADVDQLKKYHSGKHGFAVNVKNEGGPQVAASALKEILTLLIGSIVEGGEGGTGISINAEILKEKMPPGSLEITVLDDDLD